MGDVTEPGLAAHRGELAARGEEFEIYRDASGGFEILRLFGRCSPKFLSVLREKFLMQNRHLAIDAGSVSDAGYTLVREFVIAARRFRNSGRHFVLLNTRGALRETIRTAASDGLIQISITERVLEGDVLRFPKRLQDVRRQLTVIRTDLENHPAWQMVDREQVWLCPYCARVQDHLRIHPRQGIPESVIEAIWLHVSEECPDARAGRAIREMAELSGVLRRSNQEKLTASRSTATALASRVIELQGMVQEVEQSVQVAAERQRYLLPSKPPEIPEAVSALGYWPAHRVSGDFYDFLELGSNRFAVLVGDVTGHGIEAAILMGVAKKVVSIRMRDTADPALALQMANRDIYPDLDRRTFVSVFLGLLDAETREFTYVRAGHNPVILYNPDRAPQFTKLEAPGLVLGLDSGPRFNTVMGRESVRVRGGDALFFYTDGPVEAVNGAGEEFGLQRVYDRLRTHHEGSPQEAIDGLHQDLGSFRGTLPQEDDVTAYLLRFY